MSFMVLSANADNIVDYFTRSSGGSIDIPYKYTSLQRNIEQVMNSNIRVDKLLIVFSDSDTFNVKNEMVALSKLMKDNPFFRINEILVYTEGSEYCSQGLSYFKFVMSSLNFVNYNVKIYSDGITMQSLYRDTLGIVSAEDKRTSYNTVYRIENGLDSKVGYSPRVLHASIAPSSNDGVSSYSKFQENSIKTESGNIVRERPEKEIESVELDLDVFQSNLGRFTNVVVFSGMPKSGTSTVARFTATENTNCLLIDLTDSLGSVRSIKSSGVAHKVIELKELLLGDDFMDYGIKVLYPSVGKVKLDLLKYVLSIPNRIFYDSIYIDCDLSLLDELMKFLKIRVKKLVLTTESIEDEFKAISSYASKFSSTDCYLFMNNYIPFDNSVKRISIVEAKTALPSCKIVKGENLHQEDLSLEIFM